MNHLKCAFGVTSRKFLGFIVRRCGIEIEQLKIEAILKMPKPRNVHELKSLQGQLANLRRFISNLAGRCQLFSRLTKKGIPFEWDEACNNAFKCIKAYLMKPPVLAALVPRRPLVLYIAAQEHSAIKGKVLADFLADHPIPANWKLSEELLYENVLFIEVQLLWKMYFDGASYRESAGTGAMFLTPERDVLPYAFTLTQLCSNNEAEYPALILGAGNGY
ncbi:uncharacterized mitochondrial protein AtMg00860-like [Actinidia eriantha]|uniref:uncharacterized mitochondrial protein AtMg00860-like n=1 Tax=Actinidia eriantha TaxID=165200 RepID=UPI00258D80EB|nr:uncharacterized mitochondrial protein AtMg00860-like [Actinidia eriantha]